MSTPRLATVIPAKPNIGHAGHTVHKWVDRAHFALMAVEMALAETEGAIGVVSGVTAGSGGTLAQIGFASGAAGVVLFGALNVGTFGGTALGYAEARQENAAEAFMMGAAIGVVVAAHGRNPHTLKALFGNRHFGNYFDQESARISRKSYLLGLIRGYLEGSAMNAEQRKYVIRDLEVRTGRKYGKTEATNERAITDWYHALAIAFRRYWAS
ncbi:MAG: hypothetical protein HY820_20435 [Acidobacteria bacterium]|nr:hypothetical protein [Acidobacteriota bacterium]